MGLVTLLLGLPSETFRVRFRGSETGSDGPVFSELLQLCFGVASKWKKVRQFFFVVQ